MLNFVASKLAPLFNSDASVLTNTTVTTQPSATAASVLLVCVEAVVQCVDGGHECCSRLMTWTSLSSLAPSAAVARVLVFV